VASIQFVDLRSQERIRLARTAYDARKLAREMEGIRSDWEATREQFMLTGLIAKFTQHDKYYRLLKSTAPRPIAFVLPKDAPHDVRRYWSVGEDGRGENRLGALLLQLREGGLDVGFRMDADLEDPLSYADQIATASVPGNVTPLEREKIAAIKKLLDGKEVGAAGAFSEALRWKSLVYNWDRATLEWWREEERERGYLAALKVGDTRLIQEYVEGLNMSVRMLQDPDGIVHEWTPLAVVARRNRVGPVRYLVSRGAPVDGMNGQTYPPLHWAIFSGAVGAVEYLLEANASLHLVNRDGRDALQASEYVIAQLESESKADYSRDRERLARAEAIRKKLRMKLGLAPDVLLPSEKALVG
jgi:NADAR domain/Ankyrin repeats (3 copies)